MTRYYSGWDIGGAHLKVSRCNAAGEIIHSREWVCPLWRGIQELDKLVNQVLSELNNENDFHFLTLTGESADCFRDRQHGVNEILSCIGKQIAAEKCRVFSASDRWLSLSAAQQNWHQVASMNWLATASWLGQHIESGLLVDIGSTTTDIIAIKHHRPALAGLTDQARLRSGELVYTGVIRTPLIALAQQVPFAGYQQHVANELFATTGDIWRICHALPATIQDISADGQSWQLAHCRQRLARMVGTDAGQFTAEQWLTLANWYAEQQLQQLIVSANQVVQQHSLGDEDPIIAVGIGHFLAKRLAKALHRPIQSLNKNLSQQAAIGAPASALALLGWRQFT
ncbi:S-layer protein, putative [Methylophaga frappieri]|uniref:S-layer protein, putative n=1 Tax=Methylophaga frappieri (strain ATCC BAA-2434 / DSM 25690 / JAM7) TaxID=754477 RepID=I1YJ26_METFJ|nr:hydantoinase/oxoprolinase family protein [Methylophaga frappieri]AFJ02919.1 S-layer protein, putative [Methylophaga frappieri]